MESKHSLFKSFQFAFEGVLIEFKKGRNFRIQILAGALAVALGFYLGISSVEWIILIITVASVLILELMNTAIEEIVNIVSPEIRESAKIAKDVSAAAVMVAALASVFTGAIIFIPKLF
jgi:diacylglycerol kinase